MDALTEDVKNLKVHLAEVQQQQQQPGVSSGSEGPRTNMKAPVDPWAEFLRARQNGAPSGSRRGGDKGGVQGEVFKNVDQGDYLSEEDQRTLIVGGWSQDTRKATIEIEALTVLQRADIQPLLDVDKISVFGPRRSVGMIRFVQRDDEPSLAAVRERMWKVVRAIADAKIKFPSTAALGEDRNAWASFMKTKTARARTAHISLVRRVTIQLAMDTKDDGGGAVHAEHVLPAAYDMDWGAGTIWCGSQKLASATHRQPRDCECILMSGGWVNLQAIAQVSGCSVDVAKHAFELEL